MKRCGWLTLALCLLAGLARAEVDTERGIDPATRYSGEEYPRLRAFAGGALGGGFTIPFGYLGAGIAADLGVQLTPGISFSGGLRAMTAGLVSHFDFLSLVEWSFGIFSLSTGIGAGLHAIFILYGAGLYPQIVVPLGLGFTIKEQPDGTRAGSVRINVEFAFNWNPSPGTFPNGIGGSVCLSVGRLWR